MVVNNIKTNNMKITITTETKKIDEESSILGIRINGHEYASQIRNHSIHHPKLIIDLFIIPALKDYSKKFQI